MGAKFVDNDNNFLFRDGSCDTSAFKSDGICLSANGVEKLMNNLSLRHLSHRHVGTGYKKARPTGNRSSKQRRRMSSGHLLSQECRNTPNATGKRPPKHKCNSPDTLVTMPPLNTCVSQASVTSVVRQITSPRLADM